ncbi:hypothetical protein ACV07N_15650 [Roseivirga echinicomitans]
MDFEKVEFEELTVTTDYHQYSITITNLLETGEDDEISQYNMAILYRLESLTATTREEFIIHQWKYLKNREQWMRQMESLLNRALSDGHSSVHHWNMVLNGFMKEFRRIIHGKSQNSLLPLLRQDHRSDSGSLEKINTDLTVDEISLLFSIFIDSGVIDGRNKKSLSRTISKVFSSKNSKDIKEDSIYNKLTSPNEKAFTTLGSLFEELPRLLKKFEEKKFR